MQHPPWIPPLLVTRADVSCSVSARLSDSIRHSFLCLYDKLLRNPNCFSVSLCRSCSCFAWISYKEMIPATATARLDDGDASQVTSSVCQRDKAQRRLQRETRAEAQAGYRTAAGVAPTKTLGLTTGAPRFGGKVLPSPSLLVCISDPHTSSGDSQDLRRLKRCRAKSRYASGRRR